MGNLFTSYQNTDEDDPQSKTVTDDHQIEPGEALVLIYIRRPDGTIELYTAETYSQADHSTHPHDAAVIGNRVMLAIKEANKA